MLRALPGLPPFCACAEEETGALFGEADEQLHRQLQARLQGTLELDLGGAVQVGAKKEAGQWLLPAD